MAGTSEGGKKAAQTRGHKSLSEAGRKGGEVRANKARAKSASSKSANRNERRDRDEK